MLTDKHWQSLIRTAARMGYIDVLRAILKMLNESDRTTNACDGKTLLYLAAQAGNEESFLKLLPHYAPTELRNLMLSKDDTGTTIVDYLARHKLFKLLGALCRDITTSTPLYDHTGYVLALLLQKQAHKELDELLQDLLQGQSPSSVLALESIMKKSTEDPAFLQYLIKKHLHVIRTAISLAASDTKLRSILMRWVPYMPEQLAVFLTLPSI